MPQNARLGKGGFWNNVRRVVRAAPMGYGPVGHFIVQNKADLRMKRDAIVIHEKDNVATALRDLEAGATASVGTGEHVAEMRLDAAVEFGHKFAVRPIAAGENIVKYGEIIGRATAAIAPGEHAHVHNIESLRGRGDLEASA